MSNVLLNYLMANPGKADYMDLNSGTVVHTGSYGKCFGAIPTSNIYTGETGVISVKEEPVYDKEIPSITSMESYNVEVLQSFIDAFFNEKQSAQFNFVKCEDVDGRYCHGTISYNGDLYDFISSDMRELSKLVNDKSPRQLAKCLDTSCIKGYKYELSVKAKLLLYICAGF